MDARRVRAGDAVPQGRAVNAACAGKRQAPWEECPGALVVFGCHRGSKQLDGHPVLSPPSLRRDLGYLHATS